MFSQYPLVGPDIALAAVADDSGADGDTATAATGKVPCSSLSDLSVGTKVEARYGVGSEWFGATISETSVPNASSTTGCRYFLTYDDGDVEEDARRLKIRLPGQRQRRKLDVGEEVDALCEALEGLVLPATVVATSESDSSLEEDHYRVSFDATAVSMARQKARGSSRGGSRGGARVKKAGEEEAILNRRYIFGAFYNGSDSVSAGATEMVGDSGLDAQANSLKVASAYFQRIVPGTGRIFLLLPPSSSFIPGCGGSVLGHVYRFPSPTNDSASVAKKVSTLFQRYRRADMTVWEKGRMYLNMDDDAVTGMLSRLYYTYNGHSSCVLKLWFMD
jgi:hypothetical protein